jgi:acyl-CoA thioester hydrolase
MSTSVTSKSETEIITPEYETARTVVYPWQCDVMGHFATHHYMKVFDDASYHLLGRLGFSLRESYQTKQGWADVSHSIVYKHEIASGDLITACSSVLALGNKSLTYRTRLVRATEVSLDCAVLVGVMVRFDLTQRIAIALPTELRAAVARSRQ